MLTATKANMNAASTVMELFVTHIDADARSLKIWAQLDRAQAIFVERLIIQLTDLFDRGVGAVQSTLLAVGELCCAKYNDGAYYRARVSSVDKIADGLVSVQFVDYGNIELMRMSDIRSLHTLPSTLLTSLRDQASEFYLAGVIAKTPMWDDASLGIIRHHLRYEEAEGVLMGEVANKKLLRIYFKSTDFSELLISQGIGIGISLPNQQMLLQSTSMQMPSQYPPVCNFSVPPPKLIAPEKPIPVMHPNVQPPALDPRTHQSHNLATHGEKVFTTPVLDINSQHMVYVSFVEDGPWSFAVQLQAIEETLTQIMAEINEFPPTPLTHPLMPGSVCLGRFSEDQTLCRAVVMSVLTDKCMLYYVDFGNSETRPYSEIYELPLQYVNPKVMALRFTLSGLKDVPENNEMKALFKEIVTEKLLTLKVLPPDGPPVKQYCELTYNGQNVLQILLEKCKPLEYKSLPLSMGATDMSLISYIVNPSHFYMQLSRHVSALNAVMMAVEAHCTNAAEPLSQELLKVGLPCCALYAEDQRWYRAQIISILPGSVNVKYVDYGNSDIVPLSSLKKIERSLVCVLHMQAVKCCLNGFEDMKSDSLAAKFEELTGEDTLKFTILGKVEDCFIVDLYNSSSGTEVDIGNILLHMKATSEQQPVQPVQQGNKSYETPVIAETDGWEETTEETSTSQFNKTYQQTRAVEKERFNRGSSRNDDDGKESWRSQKDDRSWRNKDDGNNNWREDQDKGRRGGKWGGRNETEREHKPWRENASGSESGGQYKRKQWARDEDRGGYVGGGGSRRNAEDGESYNNRRNEDRRRNIDDNRRDEDRRKRFNNEDSRRGRDSDYRWQNADSSSFDNNSRVGRKPWNSADSNYNQFSKQNNGLFGEPLQNAEEEWDDDTTTSVRAGTTIKPPSIRIGETKTVEIVFSTNPQDFYVQVTDSSELLSLMDEIAKVYDSAAAVNAENLKSGSACIAQYAEDETWYRAIIESVSSNLALVFFCDYGNKENVPLTNVKEIKNEHVQLPAQGISCSLLAAKPQNLSWSSSEIDCFTGATDGKTFEAKFVKENSGRFEVILTDVESSKEVNLQFGAIPEELEPKAIRKESLFEIFTAPKEIQQIIELGDKYSYQSFFPESIYQVCISWFIDPGQFYCRLKSPNVAMNDMMASIQEAYCSKSPTSRPFHVGLPVIARYRADSVLYRAEVKEIVDSVSVIVNFVDFGNCDSVMNNCVWDMEARFMNLPKQAFLCALHRVKPVDADWSQSDTVKFFEAEEYQCTFHRLVEEKFEVTLVHSGKSVADNLVEAGLAKEETLEEAGTMPVDEEPVEMSLLPGQTLAVHVTFVESASKFFIHLNPAYVQNIQTVVNQLAENPENLQPVDAEKLCIGDLCLASPDSLQWYRARIVDCAQTTGVFVLFVDFGDGDEVPVDKVMMIPSTLKQHPAQAVECALYGTNIALISEAEDKFKSDIEDKDVLIKVEALDIERLLVTMYNMEGRKFEILKNTPADSHIEHLCPMPVLSHKVRAWVSHVNNANSLWLQRLNDSQSLSELLDKIHQIYEEEGKGIEISVSAGNLCAAKSESFGSWYRARILSINYEEGTCIVLFIDYGNTESVPMANIKALDASLFTPHKLAVQVSLPVTTSETLNEQLQEMTADKEFVAIFSKRNDEVWLADLFEGDISLSKQLVKQGFATFVPGAAPATVAVPLEVFVSHFDSPVQFWLQLTSNNDAILKFQENIQIIAETLPNISVNPQVGLNCIAKFSEDNLWYRVVVLDVNPSYVTVRFTDYGNTSQIDITAEGIKELPEELASIPNFAFPCCINASPIDGSYWNAEAVVRCEELLNQEANITINVVGEEEIKIVDVFIDGVSVADVLLKENLALTRQSQAIEHSHNAIQEAGKNSVETTDFKQLEVTKNLAIETDAGSNIAQHSNNDVQDCDDLELTVENDMGEIKMKTVDVFKVGVSVADVLLKESLVPESKSQAVEHSHDAIQEAGKKTTDFKQIEDAKNLVETDAEFSTAQDFSNDVQVYDEDLEFYMENESVDHSKHVVEGNEDEFNLVVESHASSVKEFYLQQLEKTKNFAVETDAESSTAQHSNNSVYDYDEDLDLAVGNDHSEHFIENSESELNLAVVSHASSLKEFWLQYQSVADQLHQLEYRLLEAESFPLLNDIAEGKLCAAIFDDNQWYRAKILKQLEEGIEVHFIDYGNTSICSDVRALPADLANLPPMAQCCSLALPKTITEWPLGAEETFLDRVNDGCVLFEVRIVEQGHPTVVSLVDDGKEIEIEICQDVLDSEVKQQMEEETQIHQNEIAVNVPESLQEVKVFKDKDDTETAASSEVKLEVEKENVHEAEDATATHLINDEQEQGTGGVVCVAERLDYEENMPEDTSINKVTVEELKSITERAIDHLNEEKQKSTKLLEVEENITEAIPNDNMPKLLAEEFEIAGFSANDNSLNVNDEIVESTKATVVCDVQSEAGALNAFENLQKPVTSESRGTCDTVKSSEYKIEHTEELVRKINVEMMVMDKEAKKFHAPTNTFFTLSALPHHNETTQTGVPEDVSKAQCENGATKSEPTTPLLSRSGRLLGQDVSEKLERSSSSPRLSHNEKIVAGSISRDDSYDSMN